MAKEKQNVIAHEIKTTIKLKIEIASRNLYGFIGVDPILFNNEEFLNSKIDCGIKISIVDKIGILNIPGTNNEGPIILPKKVNKIIGNAKVKKGPT
ncbi:MAG: hypothetical protein ACRCRZ_00210 [Metamycoplasmataceae bacterium]